MTNHQRWNKNLDEYDKAFNQTIGSRNYYRIGLIRQPLSHYVSAFNFFYVDRKLSKYNSTSSCWFEGYRQVSSTLKNQPESRNIYDFIPNIQSVTQDAFRSAFWGMRGLNFLSFEFGLNWKYKMSLEEIEETVNQFDVIIVLERLAESLILLKNLMCMDYSDIVLQTAAACSRCTNSADVDLDVEKPVVYERLNMTKYGVTGVISK